MTTIYHLPTLRPFGGGKSECPDIGMVVRSVGTSTCLYAGLEERRGKHHPERSDYLRVGALRIVQLSVCREKAICGESPYKSGFLMPDRFETLDRFDLPSQTTRPVWMMVDVPRGTVPGTYKGQVEVRAKGKAPQLLNLEIVVQNQLLPYPKDWKYRLDLWQNPWAVAWYNHVEPWSPEHKMLLKQHLKHYADAGGTYITTYGVHSPWSDNSYMIEGV